MNRRSFLWRGFCSSLPVLAGTAFSEQVAQRVAGKPSDAQLTAFSRGLAGKVFRPGDSSYERLRTGYAAKFAAHPACVVHPANLKDIQSTLDFVKSHGLPLAVRCGGHSYAGYSTCEGGVVVDMSGLSRIEIADDKSLARIGGGTLCGAVEMETSRAGAATALGQCPSVGVGGFLLGGGVGPLMSKYGLGCDNVVGAELVLADGRVVKASGAENPDLFWAIRGGGGNFGIVTTFVVALHPVSKVLAGNITLESPDPRDFLRSFSAFFPTAPDELTMIANMTAEPGKKPRIEIECCYVGEERLGEQALAPLRHHRAVVADTVRLRPYLELEQMVPADIPPSYHEHWGGFFTELDEGRIETLAKAFSSPRVPVECFLTHIHGAVTRVPAGATAFPMRRNGIVCDAASYWKPTEGQRAAQEWIQDLRMKLSVEADGAYVNGMDRDGESGVRRAYGANYARLQHLKARYDPENLFSLNQNIRPA